MLVLPHIATLDLNPLALKYFMPPFQEHGKAPQPLAEGLSISVISLTAMYIFTLSIRRTFTSETYKKKAVFHSWTGNKFVK